MSEGAQGTEGDDGDKKGENRHKSLLYVENETPYSFRMMDRKEYSGCCYGSPCYSVNMQSRDSVCKSDLLVVPFAGFVPVLVSYLDKEHSSNNYDIKAYATFDIYDNYNITGISSSLGRLYMYGNDKHSASNYCSGTLRLWQAFDAPEVMPIFNMTMETSTGTNEFDPSDPDKDVRLSSSPTVSFSSDGFPISLIYWNTTDSHLPDQCDIRNLENPIHVVARLSLLKGSRYLEGFGSVPGQQRSSLLLLRDCVYVQPFDFDNAKVILGFGNSSDTMNSFGWSLGRHDWVDCPKNTADAMSLYGKYGYNSVFCSDPSAHIALYRVPHDGDYFSYNSPRYTHASIAWRGDDVGWSSKFGRGPLMTHGNETHGDMNAVVGPYDVNVVNEVTCTAADGVPKLQYGIPALCFRGKPSALDRESTVDGRVFFFSDEEKSILAEVAAGVTPTARSAFQQKHGDWKSFVSSIPEVALSSCLSARAQGEAFWDLVGMGRDALPLVVEKLVDQEEFMSLLIYEHILGEDRGDEWVSAQEIAAAYAHSWIEEQATAQVDVDL